jgi:zinc D-Ala-D-Ala carboxypeptidase
MKLSKNFSLAELTKSQTAERMGIDNTPSDGEIDCLKSLCEQILQPVREHYGVPFIVNSGYRSVELCEAIGSSSKSQHAKGQAADFEVPNVSNYALALWISESLDFDQLILECYKSGDPSSGWVHCSYRNDGENRKEILTYQKSTGYKLGLIE